MERDHNIAGWGVLALIALRCAWPFLHGSAGILETFQDDAQYYLVIAENIVRTGRSTFDGATFTTGYHPAWLAIEVLLIWVCRGDRAVYLTALVVVCAILALAHARVLRQLLLRLSSSATWVNIVVLLVIARSLNLSFNGMESALAMPMMAWCSLETLRQLERPLKHSRLVYLGFLASLTGLARFDAIVFGVGCGALVIIHGVKPRWAARSEDGPSREAGAQPSSEQLGLAPSVGAFVVGLTPFLVYLSVLWVLTGSTMTTSAQAKTLVSGLHWSSEWFNGITWGDRICFLLVSCIGLGLVSSPWTPWRDPRRAFAIVVFTFPILYYAYIGLRTSWQLWAWYLYPGPVCSGIALVAFGECIGSRAPSLAGYAVTRARAGLAVAALVATTMVFKSLVARGNNEGVMRAAVALSTFCSTHPGKYGMGDRAGTTAFVNNSRPFLQLEGLVADSTLLEAIRHERSLVNTLVDYGVDYLVEAMPTRTVGSNFCRTFLEPNTKQAGWRSPKMRGEFCELLFRYDDARDSMTTMVYRVLRSTEPSASSPFVSNARR